MKYIKKHDCIPKDFEALTFVIKNYNYTEFRLRFCDKNFSLTKIKDLKQKCRIACYEEIYQTKKSAEFSGPMRPIPLSSKFISFESYPKLGFIQYLINLGGLLGLWHGISLNHMKTIVLNFFKKILSMSEFLRKFINYVEYLSVHKWLKIFIRYSQMKVKSFPFDKFCAIFN